MNRSHMRAVVALAGVVALSATACSSSSKAQGTPQNKTVVLMSHDSFAASKPALAAFTRETGYTVKVLKSGDAGEAVGKAIAVQDHPVADAFFGVDNTLLTKALDADLFQRYDAPGLANVPSTYELDAQHRATPIDHAEVCVNDDLAWFGKDGHPPPPRSLADLAKPAYKKLLRIVC